MRIAYVIDTIQPFYRGGYEHRAWELARRLAKRHDVTVLTSAPESCVIEGVDIRAIRPQVSYFDSSGFRNTGAGALFALAILQELRRAHAFDVVDCNATPFVYPFPAAMLARYSGAELVVTAHEALDRSLVPYFRERGSFAPVAVGMMARRLYRASHRLSPLVIATSAVAAEGLRNEGVPKVVTCAGGVTRCYTPKATYGGRLVFVGRLVYHKRVDAVIRSFALALANGAAESLTVVGEGPELPRLRALAEHLAVTSSVFFEGDVPEERKIEILTGRSDVFVSASPREGFSIATLEALSTGNPAIIVNERHGPPNGATEYLRDNVNGLIVDGTTRTISDAISAMASGGSRYREMSNNAIMTASRYTWDTVADSLLATYDSLLEIRRMRNKGSSPPCHTQSY